MANPLVSVIIPAYNAEKSVTEALDSVFCQTYRPIEIIVVDDGSTDRTSEIIKSFQSGSETSIRNLICISQHNGGPSKARNTGIKAAKGEYIAFLDADDLWSKTKLEKQIHLFREIPDLDVVFTDAKITRARADKVEEFFVFDNKELRKEFFEHEYIVINPLEKLFKLNFIHTSTVVARRGCFKNGIFFNEERRYVEDWELWLKMSLYFKFGYVNEVCMYKRETGDGLSADQLRMNLSSIDIIESFMKDNETVNLQLKNDFLSKFLKNKYKWTGHFLMKNKQNKLARSFFKKSFKKAFDLSTIFYYFKTFV